MADHSLPASAHGGDHETGGASHHIPSFGILLGTFGALVILLFATVGVSYVDLGVLNIPIAMLIAVTKAVLVVWIFMNVRFGTKLTWLWASIGFIWLLLLFGTLGDYVTRNWIRVQGW